MKKSSISYKIQQDYDFHANEKILHFLYGPIIGKNAIYLYKHLIHLQSFQLHIGSIIQLNLETLLNQLNINYDEFQNDIEILEAINLINTYKDINKNDEIVFKLIEPLKWTNFCRNDYYMNLLSSKLGEIEFEKLKYLFNGNNQLVGLTNVSKTFEQKFELHKSISINFDILHDFIFKHTNKLISLDESLKIMINDAYQKFHLSYQEICQLLLKSLVKNDNVFMFDEKLFIIALKSNEDLKNINMLNTNLKINRNNLIFIKNANLDEFKYVINDYKTLNSEQYLACIQKHAISESDRSLIRALKEEYKLPEYIINILIDYCIYRNNGRIEPLYLHKISLTINRLNLHNVNEIIQHLQNANSKVSNVFSNNDKVEW